MLKFKKVISLIVVFALVFSLPLSFADKPEHAGHGNDKESSEKWNDHALKKGQHDDEEMIEDILELIAYLEMKLNIIERDDDFDEDALDITDEEATAQLQALKEELLSLYRSETRIKFELKDLRKELRRLVRGGYTAEELAYYESLKEELEDRYEGIRVLDVDSIISKNINLKFEGLPPVIKDGRTLIPVAALVRGFGAHVEWDPVERSVLVWTDDNDNGVRDESDMDILIYIGSNITYVNGIEVEIDAEAMIMNNRTIVPLRFIAETLHLKVKWNPEDGTIEIDDADTTLTVVGNGFSIVGTQIIVPAGTTVAELDVALSAAEGGSYTIEDDDDTLLDINDDVITLTDQVVSLAENGYTEEVYSIAFAATETLLIIEGLGFYVNGLVVTVPVGTTRNLLDEALTEPEGGSYIFEDFEHGFLEMTVDAVLDTDLIKVTAQDGTTQIYTLRFASIDTSIELAGEGFSIDGDVVTVPFDTMVTDLNDAITAPEKGQYVLNDDLGTALEIDEAIVLISDVILVTAEDQVTTKEYSIVISLNKDTTLTIDGLGMSIEDTVIKVPVDTSRAALDLALEPALHGSYTLNGGSFLFDPTPLVLTDVINSIAADVTEIEDYTIEFASTDTVLTTDSDGFDVTDLVITVPFGTTRVALELAIIEATDGSYQLEDGADEVLGYDLTFVAETNVIVSLAQDETNEATYTIVVTEASTETILTTETIGFDVTDFIVTVPFGTTRDKLPLAIIEAFGGSYQLEDGLDGVLSFDATPIVESNVIISLAQDGETEATYSIVVTEASTDTTLTIDGLDMSIDDEFFIITVPVGTTGTALNDALTEAFGGTYGFEDGAGGVLEFTTDLLVDTQVIISVAQDTIEEQTYTIELQ